MARAFARWREIGAARAARSRRGSATLTRWAQPELAWAWGRWQKQCALVVSRTGLEPRTAGRRTGSQGLRRACYATHAP